VSVFGGYGAEVQLAKREDFLKVMETLTRIGAEDGINFIQECHILHKRGHYAIMHYNEMYAIDGDKSRLVQEDVERRNTVVQLLVKWGLVKTVEEIDTESLDLGNLRVLQFTEKNNWKLIPKYVMGKNRVKR
jgi:hypothetical protein